MSGPSVRNFPKQALNQALYQEAEDAEKQVSNPESETFAGKTGFGDAGA